ncbi:MAG: TetR family transcriptional regulator [Bacteroidetes bacterium]|nr:TetR family transcriptional regulator [Bacteroidota bacterium]MBS1648501.1 TetR family transcriptional regulator [Bacteroidota bacterium]
MGRIKTNDTTSRREIIIQKAATLFKEKGFKAASMRELADIVGVEAASLYNHIKNKNELLNIICFDVANRYMQMIAEIETEKKSSLEKIEKLLRFHITGMVKHFDEVYVSDREWKHLEEPYLANLQAQRRAYRKRIAAIIDDGIKKKEIKKIDASTAVLIMLHAVSGIESWHRSKAKINGKELEENMVSILVSGLKK